MVYDKLVEYDVFLVKQSRFMKPKPRRSIWTNLRRVDRQIILLKGLECKKVFTLLGETVVPRDGDYDHLIRLIL